MHYFWRGLFPVHKLKPTVHKFCVGVTGDFPNLEMLV